MLRLESRLIVHRYVLISIGFSNFHKLLVRMDWEFYFNRACKFEVGKNMYITIVVYYVGG